jgi:hypothetical protein
MVGTEYPISKTYLNEGDTFGFMSGTGTLVSPLQYFLDEVMTGNQCPITPIHRDVPVGHYCDASDRYENNNYEANLQTNILNLVSIKSDQYFICHHHSRMVSWERY